MATGWGDLAWGDGYWGGGDVFADSVTESMAITSTEAATADFSL